MSLSSFFITRLSFPSCQLCLYRNSSANRRAVIVKGKPPARRQDRPVRVPTPPRLVIIPPAPLAKYSDEFKEQALKNIDDWIAREEPCEMFDDEEKRTYEQDFENYKLEYVKWIKNYQNELSSKLQKQAEVKRDSETDQESWNKVMELSNKWNSSIKSEREKYIESLRQSSKEESEEVGDLVDSPLLDANYLSQLIKVKLNRLNNIITEDNLDERIAAALNESPVDFNFAIDTLGDVHKGTFFDKAVTMGSSEFNRSSLIRRNMNQTSSGESSSGRGSTLQRATTWTEQESLVDDIFDEIALETEHPAESSQKLLEEQPHTEVEAKDTQ